MVASRMEVCKAYDELAPSKVEQTFSEVHTRFEKRVIRIEDRFVRISLPIIYAGDTPRRILAELIPAAAPTAEISGPRLGQTMGSESA